jgi:hypothetical protein
MPLPESTSLTLQQAIRLIAKRVRKPMQCVREAFVTAAIEGRITATGCPHASTLYGEPEYFDAPLSPRTDVKPEAWEDEICWQKSRVGRYSSVRIDRAEIDRWLGMATEHVEGKAVPAATVSPGDWSTTDAVVSASSGDNTSPRTVSYSKLKETLRKHGNAPEIALLKYAKTTFAPKSVPRSLLQKAREDLFGKPARGRPKKGAK